MVFNNDKFLKNNCTEELQKKFISQIGISFRRNNVRPDSNRCLRTSSWQNGIRETIVQGYYMHQGRYVVHALFTLSLFIIIRRSKLNKPIYSYSLGILVFWHRFILYPDRNPINFVFSSIPWWLQTVAIFGSVGMVIPVIAGTTNFLMTFKNGWYQLGRQLHLPLLW